MSLTEYLIKRMFRLRNFIPSLLVIFVLASVSCGTSSGPPDDGTGVVVECDLPEQEGYNRENYYPNSNSRDLESVSPTENDYEIARKVSRSVFEIQFRKKAQPGHLGTGWLIAPGYVVTAAHSLGGGGGGRSGHTCPYI